MKFFFGILKLLKAMDVVTNFFGPFPAYLVLESVPNLCQILKSVGSVSVFKKYVYWSNHLGVPAFIYQ